MKCKKCGKTMVHVETISRGRREKRYYRCDNCGATSSEKGNKIPNVKRRF